MSIIDIEKNRGLKVGYVLKRFPRLTETFILNELLELERQGIEVEVFSLMHPPSETRHKLLSTLKARVTYLPKPSVLARTKVATGLTSVHPEALSDSLGSKAPLSNLFGGKDRATSAHLCMQSAVLAVLASSRGVTHLHAHFASNATTVAMLASRLSQIPYSFTAHARDIYHEYVDAETDNAERRQKISEASSVVTVSDYNRDYLQKLAHQDDGQKVIRIFNGINLARFRSNRGLPKHKRILSVGRLIEKKGFSHLLHACSILIQKSKDWRCQIVGDGPDRESLQDHINSQGLRDHVELVGFVSQEALVDMLADATLFVLPCVVAESGDRDGLPTVLLEALAMGIPTVSTRVAGIPEIIDHGKEGLLVEPEDPEALASAMDGLLTQVEIRKKFSRNARAKAERDFDLQKNVAILKRQFQGGTHRKGAPDAYRLRHSG